MKDKFEKDDGLILKLRAMLAMEHDSSCSCPMTECEWHGQCYECVRLHRCFADRVPSCLQALAPCAKPKAAKKLTKARQARLINAYWDQMRSATGRAQQVGSRGRQRVR